MAGSKSRTPLSVQRPGSTTRCSRMISVWSRARSGWPGMIHVGPNVLYRSKHVPGAVYAGPGSTAAGLEMLRAEAGKLARDREVLVYCGCCPWERCPNVKPAMALLQEMGFTKVKALHLETGFKVDWIDRGDDIGRASC